VTVAISDSTVGAFVAFGADLLARFGLDQLLQHELYRLADQINSIAGAESIQQIGHGRL
jgi:hypothetical protein